MERWLSGRKRSPGERVGRCRTCLVGSNPTLSARVMPLIVLDGELAVPCTCNPLQQGRIPKPGVFLLVSTKKSDVEDWVLRDKSP